jgi:hypothetical protein
MPERIAQSVFRSQTVKYPVLIHTSLAFINPSCNRDLRARSGISTRALRRTKRLFPQVDPIDQLSRNVAFSITASAYCYACNHN